MDLGIAGKVALVVGGSKGMGRAICEHFARENCKVMVVARQQAAIDATVAHLKTLGGDAAGVSADCTLEGGPRRAVEAARAAFGPPDILIYNVEMGYRLDIDTATDEDYLRGNNALVMGFAALVREAMPAMREKRWGRILTVSSAGVKQVDRTQPFIVDIAYRHAALGLSKVMSNELAPYGITVNTVGPGSVGTENHQAAFEAYAKAQGVPVEDMLAMLVGRVPMGRLGKPEEFGAVCAFLCSDLAGFVTGQTFLVDGGRYQGF